MCILKAICFAVSPSGKTHLQDGTREFSTEVLQAKGCPNRRGRPCHWILHAVRGRDAKSKLCTGRRQKTISACAYWVCACRIDFVASRVAKRHMRRSRERRVTTCYYHCMALIDLIVSHTTHMTSYDHQNVISRYRICASTTSMTMVQFRHFTCLFSDRVRRFGSSTKRRHWCRHGAITPLISSPTRRDRALLPS